MTEQTYSSPPAYTYSTGWGGDKKGLERACMCVMVENLECMCGILDVLWPGVQVRPEVSQLLTEYVAQTLAGVEGNETPSETDAGGYAVDRWTQLQSVAGTLSMLRRLACVLQRKALCTDNATRVRIEHRAWCTLLGESISPFEHPPSGGN